MGFHYDPGSVSSHPSAIDEARDILVRREESLTRIVERDRGAYWRFVHADWTFVVFTDREESGSEWGWNAPGANPGGHMQYGPDTHMKLWSNSDPRTTMGGTVPDDITAIIAEAMLAIYSGGGTYPGVIDYFGPRGLKRSYAGALD